MGRKRDVITDSDSEDVEEIVTATSSASLPETSHIKRATTHGFSPRQPLSTELSHDAPLVKPRASAARKQTDRRQPWIVVGCLVAAAIATACVRQWLRRRKLRPQSHDVEHLITRCSLQPSAAVLEASPPAPLQSTTFVVSQVFYVENLSNDNAIMQHGAEADTAFASAKAMQIAIQAGATCIGQTNTAEAALGIISLDESRSNPAVPGAIMGITASSAALVVAHQQADFALATDHLAGARTAAACCGLYAYRPTRGAISMQGVTPIAGELDSVAWLTQSAALLPQLGEAFSLPGGSTRSRTELAHLILAQDLFGVWGDELRPTCSAALYAARKWAGDEVAPVNLLTYLRDSVPAAQPLMESDSAEQLMSAFGTAANLIQQSQFVHCRCRHAHLDETSRDSASLAEVDEESLAAAKQVQKELQKAMHAALSANNGILIIPTMPGPPIQRSASADDLEEFERRTMELTSLATLSGVPQVCIPVEVAGQAVTSVSLLSLHKSDMRLLQTAAKLGQLMPEAGQAIAEAIQAEAEEEEAQQTSTSGRDVHVSKAEQCKARANEAFKAQDFEGAIAGYSGAIQADPTNPVYFSNRAMAYLKVMRFSEAKEDCDSALGLELNVKTLLRRGTAWLGLQDVDNARKDFKHVLSLEPNNRQARQELKALKTTEAIFQEDSYSEAANGLNGSPEGLL